MVAGIPTKVDYEVKVAMVCKDMGWDWATYHDQPLFFLETLDIIRQETIKEQNRASNNSSINHRGSR